MITNNYSFLVNIMKKLQTQDISLSLSLNIVESTEVKIIESNCLIGDQVSTKWRYIIDKNKGIQELIKINQAINAKRNLSDIRFSLHELNALKFAPVTSSDVERVFQLYKELVSDRRKLLTETTIEEIIVIQYNKKLNNIFDN